MDIVTAKDFFHRNRAYVPAVAFLGGLFFDMATLRRIDQTVTTIQHALYLIVVAGFLASEAGWSGFRTPRRVRDFLGTHRLAIVHFLLGSLLSAFVVFYFKSASLINSFLFFFAIVAFLLINESLLVRQLGIRLRSMLFSLCLTSYFIYLVPVFWGRVGAWPFFVAAVLSLVIGFAVSGLVSGRSHLIHKPILIPHVVVVGLITLLYLFRAIPPVPISIKHVGIYHDVERVEEGYRLSYETPSWKFWQSGDQEFYRLPGDRLYCFFSIFSPAGFQDTVKVRWLFDDPNTGWKSSDAIPVKITGGRDRGYRGFTYKRNFHAGDWQVRIETADDREIGRINLTVHDRDAGDEQRLKSEIFL